MICLKGSRHNLLPYAVWDLLGFHSYSKLWVVVPQRNIISWWWSRDFSGCWATATAAAAATGSTLLNSTYEPIVLLVIQNVELLIFANDSDRDVLKISKLLIIQFGGLIAYRVVSA